MIPLDSLFFQLAETSFRASFVIAALLLLRPWLRRIIGSQWFCVLWLLVLARLLIPFSIETPWSLWSLQVSRHAPEQTIQQPVGAISDVSEATLPGWRTRLSAGASTVASAVRSGKPVTKNASSSFSLLGVIWAAGAVAGFIALSWQTFRTRRLAALAYPVTDLQLQNVFESIDPELRRGVEIRMTEAVAVPTLAGLLLPQIWVPRTWMEQLTCDELRHVLLHELGHARRRDLFVQWLFLVAQCLHWFNPLIWIAGRLAKADREMACDAWVLARADDEGPAEYGLTLLKIVQLLRSPARTSPVLIEMATSKQDLTVRVRAIGAFRRVAAWPGILVAIVAMIGLTLVTTTAKTTSAQDNAIATSATENVQTGAAPAADLVKADVPDSSGAATLPDKDLRVELECTLVEAPLSVLRHLKEQGVLGVELLDVEQRAVPGISIVSLLTKAQHAVFLRGVSNASGVSTVTAKKISALPGSPSSIPFPRKDGDAREISVEPQVGADHQTIDLNVLPSWTRNVTTAVSVFTGQTLLLRGYENTAPDKAGESADRDEFLILVTARITDAAGKPVPAKPLPSFVEFEPQYIELTDEAVQNLKLNSVVRGADTTAEERAPVIWENAQLQAFLQAVGKLKGADLVSAPRVTARFEQRAVIEVIREFRYPKTWKPDPEKPGAWLTESWETRNAGVTLEAEARMNEGGMLTVDLKPQAVAALGFVDLETGKPAPGHRRKKTGVIQPSNRSGISRSSIDRILFGQHSKMTEPEMPDYKFVPGHRNTMVFSERSAHQNVTLKSGQSVVLVLKETEDTKPFEAEAPKGHLISIVTAKIINLTTE